MRRTVFLVLLSLLVLLAACGEPENGTPEALTPDAPGSDLEAESAPTAGPTEPALQLSFIPDGVSIDPLPIRAGIPFTVTSELHNHSGMPAANVPVILHISAEQDQLGYTSFLKLLTVTVPASGSVPIEIPVDWNLAGGAHRLWLQANRLPDAWQDRAKVEPESDLEDNLVLLDVTVDPFDAYSSDLCSGRVDVEIGPADVIAEPGRQRALVRVHNPGNRAVYNLPVVILGKDLTGISYTPAIPPCGGTAGVYVELDRAFQEGESLTVLVNPEEWVGGLEEDDNGNNQVTISAGLPPGVAVPADDGPGDYDFGIGPSDVEIPEMWLALVTVHNTGTRDADMVPIRVENEDGRQIVDAIPLVQGEGMGVAAIRIGYLWIPGGTLTFTANPEDAREAYPERNRANNVTTFTLP
jgi:hypothetical protein